MNLRYVALAAAGLASAALVACGGSTTLQVQPAAATKPATTSAQQTATAGCDAGTWRGAISPEGRPDGLDAGDQGAVYVWHDGGGWHVRSTDARPVDHHYTGAIHLDPASANFTDVRPVRDENDDRVFVDGTNTLHYDFHTFASIDGVDFRVSCPADRRGQRERERLAFHTELDGHPMADRVRIGDTKRSPRSADFAFVRSA